MCGRHSPRRRADGFGPRPGPVSACEPDGHGLALAEPLCSRFARVRVRACGENTAKSQPEEWLLAEWPKDAKQPTKFWLSTLPQDIDFPHMVDIAMMRWRIARTCDAVRLGHR